MSSSVAVLDCTNDIPHCIFVDRVGFCEYYMPIFYLCRIPNVLYFFQNLVFPFGKSNSKFH